MARGPYLSGRVTVRPGVGAPARRPVVYDRKVRACLRVVIAWIVMSSAVAGADGKRRVPPPAPAPEPAPAPAPATENAWSKGVSPEARERAQGLLAQANEQFLARRYKEALQTYEEAVAAWDHPGIRFNMARVLIALDRPLEASANLERALAYGKEPLEDQTYAEALNYQRLLAGQIAELHVRCGQSGVDVKLDGEQLLKCPGEVTRKLLPGSHALVGTQPGMLTHSEDVMLLGGKRRDVELVLVTLESATEYRRRWDVWKPWAIAGAGAVVAGLGVLLDLKARGDMDELGRALASCGAEGCTRERYAMEFAPREDQARFEHRLGVTVIAVGAGAVLAGLVGVVLNRERPYVHEHADAGSVVPVATPSGAGVAVVGRF